MDNLDQIRDQIIAIADPTVYLFVCLAGKGTARPESDIDLCIVARTEHKRRLLTELYFKVDANLPIDFLLYTPEEWETAWRMNSALQTSFCARGASLWLTANDTTTGTTKPGMTWTARAYYWSKAG